VNTLGALVLKPSFSPWPEEMHHRQLSFAAVLNALANYHSGWIQDGIGRLRRQGPIITYVVLPTPW